MEGLIIGTRSPTYIFYFKPVIEGRIIGIQPPIYVSF